MRLFLLLPFLFVLGCVMQPLPTGKSDQYKRVGILSAMGDRFATSAVGMTVFGNEFREQSLDMGVDKLFIDKVTPLLGKKFEVVDLTKYRDAFMAAPKYWPGQKGLFSNDGQSISEIVHSLMGQEKLDAYILITPAYSSVRSTNQSIAGIGIVAPGSLFGGANYFHAAYIISVIDGLSYEIVADMKAVPLGQSSAISLMSNGPANVPTVTVPQAYAQNPAQFKEQIKGVLAQILDQSLPETLQRANLLP